jgi:hypothetical protein
MDLPVNRFLRYLTSLSPQDALRKAGVFSKGFWLKSVL